MNLIRTLLFLITILINFNVKASGTYVCDSVNSLSFSKIPSATTAPLEMNFNNFQLMYCAREGNYLVYRKLNCAKENTTIRFDWVIKEILLNEPPHQLTLKCKTI